MDFFEHQDAARRATRKLVVMFAMAVVGVVLGVYAVFAFVAIPPSAYQGSPAAYVTEVMVNPDSERQRAIGFEDWLVHRSWWNPELFFPVAGGTVLLVLAGSAVRASQLAGGGRAVASMLGGRLLHASATEPAERRLLNVVEEMALASGVPVPPVYVLAEETGINAFAAGHSTGDAVIGITQGGMRLLSRDELQGVIAHEFSHILNGDMRLNMRLMAVVFGITMIANIGQAVVRLAAQSGRHVRGDSRGGAAFPVAFFLLGALLYAVGSLGVLFGSLIRSAISRQREFLADASSVQFTRNPGGIAGALKKIGGLVGGSRLRAVRAAEAGHFYFGNGLRETWFSAFATHPPLEERIRRIEPSFDGAFPEIRLPEQPAPPPDLPRERAAALARLARPGNPSDFVANVGMLSADQVYYVDAIRRGIPQTLIDAAHDPVGASAAVFGLLLSDDGAVCAGQLRRLHQRVGPGAFRETESLLPEVRSLPSDLRLPLADVAVQALRQLSPSQFAQFLEAIDELIRGDERVDLFEFALQRLLRNHLEPHFRDVAPPQVRFKTWRDVLPDALLMLSALAHAGSAGDPARAENAFRAGASQIDTPQRIAWPIAAPAECCVLDRIDAALARLREMSPWLKKNFLFSAATTVMADRQVSIEESELLRAIADTLDCPVPPMARGAAADVAVAHEETPQRGV